MIFPMKFPCQSTRACDRVFRHDDENKIIIDSESDDLENGTGVLQR